MRTILSTVMLLTLGGSVTHAAKPIVVEAEGLRFPDGWRVVDADYLAGAACSKGGMARCGPGEAVGSLAVTDPGKYHVWVRAHGEPQRGVRVRVAGQVLPGTAGTRSAAWWNVGTVTLPPGKQEIALLEAENGPYADVILLTMDPDYDPQTDFKFFTAARLLPLSSPTIVTKASRPTEGSVKPLHQIDVSPFGVWCGLRLGDLDGDDRLDIVLAQNVGQSITCLTAIDVDGKKLWQVGRPTPGNHNTSFDLPVQIYDIDCDGTSEVICVMDHKLKILGGNGGALEREVRLPSDDARDCIVIGNFSGNAQPQDVLVKNRYGKVWALDRNLKVTWSHDGNTGHYPWPHDFDGDGRDELVCGFALLSHDGTMKWEAKLPGHSDGTAVGEVDGNAENGAEIALATCGGNTFALLSGDGKILWRDPCGHSQHIVIGDFRPQIPGKELAALDRGNTRAADGTDAMLLYTAAGKQIWREKRTDPGPNRWITVLTTVCDWDDQPRDLILAYRRGGSICPTLYDGHGKPVATFPFPNPSEQHFAQHADMEGDAREEIVVWNENWVYIYGNAAPCPKGMEKSRRREPNKRLYNYTHYIGTP